VCNTHAVTITEPIQLVAVGCVVEGLCGKMASEGLCRKMASEDGFRMGVFSVTVLATMIALIQ